MGGQSSKSGSRPRSPGYSRGGGGKSSGKSGQQPQAPSYGNAMQTAGQLGGQMFGGGSGKGGGGQSGGKGGQPFAAPTYGQALGQAMQGAGAALGGAGGWAGATPQGTQTGALQPSGNWQNYAGMTANPNPTMPPDIGAPQTGAFPFDQQQRDRRFQGHPRQGQRGSNMPGWGRNGMTPEQIQAYMQKPGAIAPQMQGDSPTQEFYDFVNQTLGYKQMATIGQYDKGWNQESSPNSRAAAKADAEKLSQALGRPLTRAEIFMLNLRAQGWGFFPVGIDSRTGQKPYDNGLGLEGTIAAIIQGQDVGQPLAGAPQDSTNPNELAWLQQYLAGK